jgi:hypothetical protein
MLNEHSANFNGEAQMTKEAPDAQMIESATSAREGVVALL